MGLVRPATKRRYTHSFLSTCCEPCPASPETSVACSPATSGSRGESTYVTTTTTATRALRPYEIVIVFDTVLEEPSIKAVLDRTIEIVRSSGGQPGRLERWGRRKLAYEIKRDRKHNEGYYLLLEATATPSIITEIDRALMLAEGVLRHKVIRVPNQSPDRSIAAPPSLDEANAAANERDRSERAERSDRPGRGERRSRS
jgi:small subunit ribosomal protein S6